MIAFKQTHPTGSDCTAPYDVTTDVPYTVERFANETVGKGDQWGKFRIYDIKTKQGVECEFKYRGEWITPIPPEYLNRQIAGTVKASGGWGNMDYYLKVY